MAVASRDMELRKIRPADLCTLARILETSDSWQTLMGIIPKEGTENTPKFRTDHFDLIKKASYQQRRSPAEIFLEEWGTMGRRRPTLTSVLELLVRAELFRAADFVAVDLLGGQPPERPKYGPAAPIEISPEELARLLKGESSASDSFDSTSANSNERFENALDRIGYPSELDANVRPRNREDTAPNEDPSLSGPQFHQEMANLSLPESNEEVKSDLIKFSAERTTSNNDTSNTDGSTNSNLIQFSRTNSRPDAVDVTEANPNQDDRGVVELQSNELPVFVAAMGRSSTSVYTELNTNELPQFVAELGNSTNSISTGNKSSEIMSSEISDSVTESANTSRDATNYSSGQTTSVSGNNFSIPIFTNNVLLSSQLPECVAELGRDD